MMPHCMSNRMLGGKLFGGSWNTDVSEMSVKGVCEMFSFGGRIALPCSTDEAYVGRNRSWM